MAYFRQIGSLVMPNATEVLRFITIDKLGQSANKLT
jgi:hypothetical protein